MLPSRNAISRKFLQEGRNAGLRRSFHVALRTRNAGQSLSRAVEFRRAYREFVGLSTIRYDRGLSSFVTSSTQMQMYPAEGASANYDLGRKLAVVDLYHALGGGSNLSDTQWTTGGVSASATQTPSPRFPSWLDLRRVSLYTTFTSSTTTQYCTDCRANPQSISPIPKTPSLRAGRLSA
jgi:hypothetical protein